MNAYALFELLHVLCAIVWVGGGFTLLYAAGGARRKRGPSGVMPVVDLVARPGPPLFVPIALLTVVSGVAGAWIGGRLHPLWGMLGLVGFVATFLNGLLLIKPRAEALASMAEAQGADHPARLPHADKLLVIGTAFTLVPGMKRQPAPA